MTAVVAPHKVVARPRELDRSVLEYELARLPREVTTAISWYMEEKGISQRALAETLKVTPGRVSQILSGDENLTLRTLATVCAGLNAHFEVDLVPNTGKETAARNQEGHRARLEPSNSVSAASPVAASLSSYSH